MTNLVETLDRVLVLYVPVLTGMMMANPEFAGIDTCIGRDDPKAWPTTDVPPGYANGRSNAQFEMQAAEALLMLVEPTFELIETCQVIADSDEPVGVQAWRSEGNMSETQPTMNVVASVSDGLGGISVTRNATCVDIAGLFLSTEATLTITTMPGLTETQMARMNSLSKNGLIEVASYLAENGLILNSSCETQHQIAAWVEAFPEPGTIMVENLGHGGHRLHSSSRLKMTKVLATTDYAERNFKSVSGANAADAIPVEIIANMTTENALNFAR